MQKRFCEIICSIAIMFLIIYCSVVYAENKSCPPNNVIHSLTNNVEKVFTDYEELKKIDMTKLPLDYKQQLLNTMNVYDHCDKESKMKFIEEFPNTFKKFLDIYQSNNLLKVHYSGDAPFIVLDFIAEEYPEQSVDLLVSLGSEAKYDADAPSALQDIFTNFFIKNPDLTISKIKQLSLQKQKNIGSFLADVETIRTYPEYQSILDILKSRHETKLYNMFLEAKKNKIAELKCEHM